MNTPSCSWKRPVVVTMVVVGAFLGAPPSASWAVTPAPVTVSPGEAEPGKSLRAVVQEIALNDPLWEVRAAASDALKDSRGEPAIEEFLAVGLDTTRTAALATRARNREAVRDILDTHPAQEYPRVHAAALAALNGTDDDRNTFLTLGFTQTSTEDHKEGEQRHQRARNSDRAVRDFLHQQVLSAPGSAVSALARWVLRPEATPHDVREFFETGLAAAATQDMGDYQNTIAAGEVARHAKREELTAAAKQAEAEAMTASGIAGKQAQETASAAWKQLAEHATVAHQSWLAEQEITSKQAQFWGHLAQTAPLDGVSWSGVSTVIARAQYGWETENTTASAQVAFWAEVLQTANAHEKDISNK